MKPLPLPASPYVERVAQIICNGLYPEAKSSGKTLGDFPPATRENLLAIAEAILVEAPPAEHPALEYAWWVSSSPVLDDLAPAQLLAGQPLDTIDGAPIPVDSHQTAHLEKPWRARLSMLIYALQWADPRKVLA
ncbi:hypothetical protein [Cupriavidus plantarum]|uniref:hypothetical protein n=1 Tax=Cupriavidus plantarum TaxID=942865 RepID=UPI000E254A32|nr:hypothetical protein [Cupriavidus plantarum]